MLIYFFLIEIKIKNTETSFTKKSKNKDGKLLIKPLPTFLIELQKNQISKRKTGILNATRCQRTLPLLVESKRCPY